MTNVEALKAVYTAIGGSAADVADVKTTAKVIEKISEIATPGGGGSGDFKKGTVKITNSTDSQVFFTMGPYINSDDEMYAGELDILSGATYDLYAVLYKDMGNYIELLSEDINIVATGEAEVDGGYCQISGDCTITFTT